jgi:hypothetical protein
MKAAKVAENKATKEAKVVAKQRKAAGDEAAKERLMQMEVDESHVQAKAQQRRIRRRSDMKGSSGDKDDMALDNGGDEPETGNVGVTGKKSRAKVSFGVYTM